MKVSLIIPACNAGSCVDVIIPTYRRPNNLSKAIDCVLRQTYSNIGVIVVDDNSDGDEFRKETEIVMNKYAGNDKIRYIKHSQNKNGSAARNTGIKASNADYIAFLDDDDLWSPNKIEKQLEYLNAKGSSYSCVSCFHVRRYKEFTYRAVNFKEQESGNYFFGLLTDKNPTSTSTLLFRKEVFEKIMFDESFPRHQDTELLSNFYRYFKMAVCPHFLVSMQFEGERNYPGRENISAIKQKLLGKYKDDIQQMPLAMQKEIYSYQNLEMNKMKFHNNFFYSSIKKISAIVLGLTKFRKFMDMQKYWDGV